MRTNFDFTPYRRSTVGFDRLFDLLETGLRAYASSATVWRQFCGHCGSSLFWSRTHGNWSDWICIALSTLDSAFMPQQQKHVHMASKPTWSDFGAACAHGE